MQDLGPLTVILIVIWIQKMVDQVMLLTLTITSHAFTLIPKDEDNFCQISKDNQDGLIDESCQVKIIKIVRFLGTN